MTGTDPVKTPGDHPNTPREFSDDELLRYSRHLLLPQIDIAGQQKLLAATVLIVGAGGLGSPVALYLGSAGVGHLLIADGDRVELSNLQRQIAHSTARIGVNKAESAAQAVRALNPHVQVDTLGWLDADNIAAAVARADVVVDASDNFGIRFLLNQTCVAQRKPLVSGAAIRGEAQLAVFSNRGDCPCYACLYGAAAGDDEGDGHVEGDTCARSGVLAPLVGVIGSWQALETIKLLVGLAPNSGRIWLVDAWRSEWRAMYVRRDPDCPVCASRHD